MKDEAWFAQLKRKCKGLMPVAVYQELYKTAGARAQSNALEIGTGRGASTISIASGIQDAGGAGRVYAIDQFYQGRPTGPHKHALRTAPKREVVRKNLVDFKNNLRAYGVVDRVQPIVGRSDEVKVDADLRFGYLFIDVDGMIDRDLALFYHMIEPGSPIVLDDIGTTDEKLGEKYYGAEGLEAYRNSQERGEDHIAKLSGYERKRLLGKHYLGALLLEYFIDRGLLKLSHKIGSTAFCVKTGEAAAGDPVFFAHSAEDEVVARFLEMAEARVS
jgi:predicted O-methyltransferase YrrM